MVRWIGIVAGTSAIGGTIGGALSIASDNPNAITTFPIFGSVIGLSLGLFLAPVIAKDDSVELIPSPPLGDSDVFVVPGSPLGDSDVLPAYDSSEIQALRPEELAAEREPTNRPLEYFVENHPYAKVEQAPINAIYRKVPQSLRAQEIRIRYVNPNTVADALEDHVAEALTKGRRPNADPALRDRKDYMDLLYREAVDALASGGIRGMSHAKTNAEEIERWVNRQMLARHGGSQEGQ